MVYCCKQKQNMEKMEVDDVVDLSIPQATVRDLQALTQTAGLTITRAAAPTISPAGGVNDQAAVSNPSLPPPAPADSGVAAIVTDNGNSVPNAPPAVTGNNNAVPAGHQDNGKNK